jgi:hypothetical protein
VTNRPPGLSRVYFGSIAIGAGVCGAIGLVAGGFEGAMWGVLAGAVVGEVIAMLIFADEVL